MNTELDKLIGHLEKARAKECPSYRRLRGAEGTVQNEDWYRLLAFSDNMNGFSSVAWMPHNRERTIAQWSGADPALLALVLSPDAFARAQAWSGGGMFVADPLEAYDYYRHDLEIILFRSNEPLELRRERIQLLNQSALARLAEWARRCGDTSGWAPEDEGKTALADPEGAVWRQAVRLAVDKVMWNDEEGRAFGALKAGAPLAELRRRVAERLTQMAGGCTPSEIYDLARTILNEEKAAMQWEQYETHRGMDDSADYPDVP